VNEASVWTCSNKASAPTHLRSEGTGECFFKGRAASIVTPTIQVHLMPRLRISGFLPPLHLSGQPYSFQCRDNVCARLSTNDMLARSKHVPRLTSTTSVCLKFNVLHHEMRGAKFLHFYHSVWWLRWLILKVAECVLWNLKLSVASVWQCGPCRSASDNFVLPTLLWFQNLGIPNCF